MDYQNQYYDSNIYMQSKNLILKAAYLYYYKGMRQQEIAEQLEISISTVSRLLRKAKEQRIIHMSIDQTYLDCLMLEETLRERFGLKEVIVAPLQEREEDMRREDLKKMVGLEGARYLQRMVTDCDMVGVAFGETVWYVYNYLNPCQRRDVGFVTLHGALYHKENKLDGSWLVPRIAKAFGGKSYAFKQKGIQDSREDVLRMLENENVRTVFEQFHKITVSISGVGLIASEPQSVLMQGNYMSQQTKQDLLRSDACCDILLRFLDKNGVECDTSMRSRIVGIPLESYKRIPNKVIVAAGASKWKAVLALLRNRLIDTLIIDQGLAQSIFETLPTER